MNNYNDFDDNDYEVDDLNNLDSDDFNNESGSILDKVKFKFNKLNNNIKSKFNKNESNFNNQQNQPNNYGNDNYGDDNLENVGNVAFYRKKPFIFGSIGLVSIALLATAIAVPLSLQQTSSSNEDGIIPPIDTTDYSAKLRTINALPNAQKVSIWNQYVNQPGVLLNWINPSDQIKILNFLKNNYDTFIDPNSEKFNIDSQSGPQVNSIEVFNKALDSFIAKNGQYYQELAYDTFLKSADSSKSFFDLSMSSTGGTSLKNIFPISKIVSFWDGLSSSVDNSGISISNVSINFSLDEMSIRLLYNESRFLSNQFVSTDKNFFIFTLENSTMPNKGIALKPKNNQLVIKNSDPIFSGFTTWIKNYLINNIN